MDYARRFRIGSCRDKFKFSEVIGEKHSRNLELRTKIFRRVENSQKISRESQLSLSGMIFISFRELGFLTFFRQFLVIITIIEWDFNYVVLTNIYQRKILHQITLSPPEMRRKLFFESVVFFTFRWPHHFRSPKNMSFSLAHQELSKKCWDFIDHSPICSTTNDITFKEQK